MLACEMSLPKHFDVSVEIIGLLQLISSNPLTTVINSTDMYRKEAGHLAQAHMVGQFQIALAKA